MSPLSRLTQLSIAKPAAFGLLRIQHNQPTGRDIRLLGARSEGFRGRGEVSAPSRLSL